MIFIDSFSGAAADLKKGSREPINILNALKDDPRVSTWDMSETPWLRNRISLLIKDGLLAELDEPYPWHRYKITEKGEKELTQ